MKKQVHKIDDNGFYIEPVVLNINDVLPNNYIDIDIPEGLYRAKWDGVMWVEDMPQADIDALNSTPQPLSAVEQLRVETAQANAEMFEMLLMMTGGMM